MKKNMLAHGILLAVSATLLGSLAACQRDDRPVLSMTVAPTESTAPVTAATEPDGNHHGRRAERGDYRQPALQPLF